MSAPVIAEHDVTVYQGDVREHLLRMPAASVQCVVTSPPYFGLRAYTEDPREIGRELTPDEYIETMYTTLALVRVVLATDGVLWLNIGDSYVSHDRGGWRQGEHLNPGGRPAAKGSGRNRAGTRAPGLSPKNLMGMPWRLAFALQDDGWILRNAVIWRKSNPMPDSAKDRLTPSYEHLFLFSKSRRYWFDLDSIKVPTTGLAPGNSAETWQRYGAATGTDSRRYGGNPTSTLSQVHETRNPGDVWTFPTEGFAGAHFAVMPSRLVSRCILAGCPEGGTVLDPFAGSGTTLKVARSLGRKSIGIELNPDYMHIIRDRIGPAPLDFSEAIG
jgi:DNA modification methylase